MKDGDSDGATRNSAPCQGFYNRPKTQFCSLFLSLPLVCVFAVHAFLEILSAAQSSE